MKTWLFFVMFCLPTPEGEWCAVISKIESRETCEETLRLVQKWVRPPFEVRLADCTPAALVTNIQPKETWRE